METTTRAPADIDELDRRALHQELADEGYDLPELADSMEEADARATASTYLFALRSIKRDVKANDNEFDVLQAFNRTRHVVRQTGLIQRMAYLGSELKKLFGFMTVTGKKKSLNLLGGRIGTKGQPDELVVENPDEVIQWVFRHEIDGLVKTKYSLDLKALRAYMQSAPVIQGQDIPPGVSLEERPDKFFATPATD